MAKTDWQMGDTVKPDDLNQIGQEINDNSASINNHISDYVRNPGYAVATGSADNYAVTLTPAATEYVDGMAVAVKINVDNTGASTINVNGLGAKAIKKPNGNDVSAGNLKAGSIYTLRYNGTNFILQGEGGSGNAQPADVLSGKTFTNDAGDQIGTMTNRGAINQTLTSQGQSYTVPAGYHNGSGKVTANITNLTAANIKSGVAVGGVEGTFTSDATATAAQILSGQTAYVNGSKVTGSMANRGAVNETLTSQGQSYTVPAGYHNGSGKVTANITNLTAANIKAGVSVGGVAGTFTSDATATAAQILYGQTAYVNGSKITGSMSNRTGHVTGQSISRSGTTLRIRPQPGYYPGDSGNSVQWNDPNWVAQNIREGVSIFGLTGTLTERKFESGRVTAAMTGVIDVSRLSFQPVLVVIQGITQTSEIAILNSLSYIKVFLFDSGVNNTSYINFTSDNYIEPDGFIITYSYFANHQFSWWAWG
jgi:hypothetical protein